MYDFSEEVSDIGLPERSTNPCSYKNPLLYPKYATSVYFSHPDACDYEEADLISNGPYVPRG